VGDLLNAKGITWAGFKAALRRRVWTLKDAQSAASITPSGRDDAVVNAGDYIPHHEPFMYYPQTTNQHHVSPERPEADRTSSDGANHPVTT